MARAQILYRKLGGGRNVWELVAVNGSIREICGGIIEPLQLELYGEHIAQKLKSYGLGLGQYEEGNGFRHHPLWRFGSSNDDVIDSKPIDSDDAYSLHWIILNEMLKLEDKSLGAKAA